MYQKLLDQLTLKMNEIEGVLRRTRAIGFDNMTDFEIALYESECEYWDKLKHDRDLLKQLIRGEINQDKFNEQAIVFKIELTLCSTRGIII